MKFIKRLVSLLLAVAGLGCIVVGAYMVYPAVGVIVGGVVLLALGARVIDAW